MTEHLLLFDASGFAHRAFHSHAKRYRESDGLPTWAILGFAGLVWRMLGAAAADMPTFAAAVFDAPGPTFRHKLFSSYKANRGERAPELDAQLPYMRHVANTLGIKPIEAEGFEADDVIATLATIAKREGWRTTIVSQDKDFAQLVEDGVIEIIDPVQRRRILSADVVAKFGVLPSQMVDFQALRGDDVDGIPGVPSCGAKRAAVLVRRFGSLKSVLENADLCRWPETRANLKRHAAAARLSYRLAKLRCNTPLSVTFDELRPGVPEFGHLKDLLLKFEASSMMSAIFNIDRDTARSVEKIEHPYTWWHDELKTPGQDIPDVPQCGYYRRRLVKGAAPVPACVWREAEIDINGEPTGRDVLFCTVNGERKDPTSEWARLAMDAISEAEFRFMVADADHARAHRPDDPKASPHQPVDYLKIPLPTFKKPKRKK